MDIHYPYQFDARGHTESVRRDKHIRDMIEQVLFTSPGERVNRPNFGSGLMQLIFAPNSDSLAAATQQTVHGSLQEWLGNVIEVEDVDIVNEDSRLHVRIQYKHRDNPDRRVETFIREI